VCNLKIESSRSSNTILNPLPRSFSAAESATRNLRALHLLTPSLSLYYRLFSSPAFPRHLEMHDTFSHLIMHLQHQLTRTEWQTLPAQAQKFFLQKANQAHEVIYEIQWENLPETAKQYIKEHPYQTAFIVVGCLVYLSPSSITAPALKTLGFTSRGPQSGKKINLYTLIEEET
jgi:hypothetical protein